MSPQGQRKGLGRRGAHEMGVAALGRQVHGQSVLLRPAGVACELLGGALPREAHPALQSKQAALRRAQLAGALLRQQDGGGQARTT